MGSLMENYPLIARRSVFHFLGRNYTQYDDGKSHPSLRCPADAEPSRSAAGAAHSCAGSRTRVQGRISEGSWSAGCRAAGTRGARLPSAPEGRPHLLLSAAAGRTWAAATRWPRPVPVRRVCSQWAHGCQRTLLGC